MNSSVLSGLEVIKILKRAEFIAVRQKGPILDLKKLEIMDLFINELLK